MQFHAQTTRGDFSELYGLDNWRYMAAGIVMAEHYLLTGDADILPELQEVHDYLSPYPESGYMIEATRHTSLMGTHPESFPDTHGSPTMGMGYAAAALAFDLDSLRSVMDANRFWFALSQCPDGSYYYQPNRDTAGFGSDSRITASAVTAFISSIPLQNLVVMGRP